MRSRRNLLGRLNRLFAAAYPILQHLVEKGLETTRAVSKQATLLGSDHFGAE